MNDPINHVKLDEDILEMQLRTSFAEDKRTVIDVREETNQLSHMVGAIHESLIKRTEKLERKVSDLENQIKEGGQYK